MKTKSIILSFASLLLFGGCTSSKALFGRGKVQYLDSSKEVSVLPARVERNLFFVDVQIEGETYNFLFDSGAPMVISKELAEKYDCKVLKNGKITDSQDRVRYQPYVKLPDILIGDRVFSNLAGIAADLKASAILNCLNIDGIIGANAMSLQYWDFSVADSTLKVSRTKDHWPAGKKYVIPFGMKSTKTPVITLKVNNTDVSRITFDTGSGGILSFNQSMTSSFKPENAHLASYGYLSGGLFGSSLDTAYEHMMTFNFPDTNLRVPIEQELSKEGKLLGMGFLRDYHVFFDYPEQKILLMPKKAPEQQASFPFSFNYQEGKVIIGMLTSLLPEEAKTLVVGDVVTSVNDENIPENPGIADYCRALEQMTGTEVQIEIEGKGRFVLERVPLILPD